MTNFSLGTKFEIKREETFSPSQPPSCYIENTVAILKYPATYMYLHIVCTFLERTFVPVDCKYVAGHYTI